jgi:hypothetical protein
MSLTLGYFTDELATRRADSKRPCSCCTADKRDELASLRLSSENTPCSVSEPTTYDRATSEKRHTTVIKSNVSFGSNADMSRLLVETAPCVSEGFFAATSVTISVGFKGPRHRFPNGFNLLRRRDTKLGFGVGNRFRRWLPMRCGSCALAGGGRSFSKCIEPRIDLATDFRDFLRTWSSVAD